MSRVGEMPVAIPAGVDVSIKEDQINVKGTGGTLALARNALVNVTNKDGKLSREELCIRISKSRGIPIKGEQPQPKPASEPKPAEKPAAAPWLRNRQRRRDKA